MTAAVDTNILLDVLIPDQAFSISSRKLLDYHLSRGKLVISEVVFAELAAGFPSEEDLRLFLADTGMALVHSNTRSLSIAGMRWASFARKGDESRVSCARCGHAFGVACPQCKAVPLKRFHVLADFLIGAHALVHADCLLSRDFGIYKTHFSDLNVVGSI